MMDELDRFTTEALEACLERRTSKRWNATGDELGRFYVVLGRISDRFRVHPSNILSSGKDSELIKARWALYQHLDRQGYSVAQISRLTGHDRSRIYHWKQTTKTT